MPSWNSFLNLESNRFRAISIVDLAQLKQFISTKDKEISISDLS